MTEKYLGLKEVMEYTGFKKTFLYKYSSEEMEKDWRLPSYVVGGSRRWKMSEVERWMQKFKVKAS